MMFSRNFVELEDKIKLLEATRGGVNAELADTITRLAHLCFIFNRFSQAESLYWRAVSIRSQLFGEQDLSVSSALTDLGQLYQSQGQFPEAEHVFRLAYAIKVSNLGLFDDGVMAAARNVVSACRAQRKHIPESELERLAKVAI